MMKKTLRIGTRDSQLAIWQATLVQQELARHGTASELIYIKSEGDIDLVTPLYEMGVQGIFTKTLDTALLSNRIDIAVHSMKDVPTQMAKGIHQAAVLKRASCKDLLVYKDDAILQDLGFVDGEWSIVNRNTSILSKRQTPNAKLTIATSSIRRKAQWLHRYPNHVVDPLRGNVNTRLQKLADSNWNGAIFAAAGLERLGLRPEKSIELDWMLPAPSQGAIMVVCRENDTESFEACTPLNDEATALCTHIEKDFLRTLMGGCSTPISAFVALREDTVYFEGNIFSPNGKEKAEIALSASIYESHNLGRKAAQQLLNQSAGSIITAIRNAEL